MFIDGSKVIYMRGCNVFTCGVPRIKLFADENITVYFSKSVNDIESKLESDLQFVGPWLTKIS